MAPLSAWAGAEAASAEGVSRYYVKEYKVEGGVGDVKRIDIERAVYPYMGPYRTEEDVEKARLALEDVYRAAGYQGVSVEVPDQNVDSGVVVLKVSEGRVGKLRVKGSRYYSLEQIKAGAPSMQEGKALNFNGMSKDLLALNQYPGRSISPTVTAGREIGTYDVYLNVEDSAPWHGSTELNNRYSADTSELRWNGSLSYTNLWQQGHTIGFSFQESPLNFDEGGVYSGYYLAPIPEMEWLRLMLQGTDSNSNVSTLGGASSVGKGYTVGPRAIITLPGDEKYSQNLVLGVDYKNFDQETTIGAATVSSVPVSYVPLSIQYGSTLTGKGYVTEFNAAATVGLRGIGTDSEEIGANKRFGGDSNFFYLTGDVSQTQELWEGMQLFVQASGQVSPQPLIDNEEFSLGGLDTVRGYLESEALGDNAIVGNFELRTPSLTRWIGSDVTDWRFYIFNDTGFTSLNGRPPAGQDDSFFLSSIGLGSRIRLYDHYYGSFDLTRALTNGVNTMSGDMRVLFQLGAQF